MQESIAGYKFTSISSENELIHIKLEVLWRNDTIYTNYCT
ncbi:hypothetical protein M085_3818, partial [Bacteroides fragilis str. 3986 N(B)19]